LPGSNPGTSKNGCFPIPLLIAIPQPFAEGQKHESIQDEEDGDADAYDGDHAT
jgi:hypothetical protein